MLRTINLPYVIARTHKVRAGKAAIRVFSTHWSTLLSSSTYAIWYTLTYPPAVTRFRAGEPSLSTICRQASVSILQNFAVDHRYAKAHIQL